MVHACILLVHACILLLLYYFQQPSFKVQYNSKWFVLLGNRKYREQLPNCLKKKSNKKINHNWMLTWREIHQKDLFEKK